MKHALMIAATVLTLVVPLACRADMQLIGPEAQPALERMNYTPDKEPDQAAVGVEYLAVGRDQVELRFKVPDTVDVAAVTEAKLLLNLHFAATGRSGMAWSVLDPVTSRWTRLARPASRHHGVWQWFALGLKRQLAAYLDGDRRLTLRLASTAGQVAADYLALAVYGVGDTPAWLPRMGQTWQVQLSIQPPATVDKTVPADVFDIDLFDVSAADMADLHGQGKSVVCYFSAGSYENWRPDADRFPASTKGWAMEGWPGERWLDIRRIGALASVMTARLDLAVVKGCDGVDPDNINGYSNRTGRRQSADQQLTYNRWLATEAHRRGLAIGLKNDIEQVLQLVDTYDWELNEQCFVYDECSTLTPFVTAGKPVINIEYRSDPAEFFNQVCPAAESLDFMSMNKTLALGPEWTICP